MDDKDDEWTEAIKAAHPTKNGSHKTYEIAMDMVGNRHSKGALVELVNWLLVEREAKETTIVDDRAAWAMAGKSPVYRPRNIVQKLGYLAEECGELLAAIGKTVRWGLESVNPEVPNSRNSESNARWILRELADLELAAGIAKRALLEWLEGYGEKQ